MQEELRVLCEGKFLRLIKEGRWEYADRVNADGAVMIVAVTAERKLILVEEYRYPLHAFTLGLPAGISGDVGEESKRECACRELREEAGYEAEHMEYLCDGPSSPGMGTEVISFFMAGGLTRVSEGGGVDNECITVHEIPLGQVHDWLFEQMAQGKAVDPKIFTGLYFLSR